MYLQGCEKPRKGWYCTWYAGHSGRCDEWPTWWTSVKLWMRGR